MISFDFGLDADQRIVGSWHEIGISTPQAFQNNVAHGSKKETTATAPLSTVQS